MINWEKYGKWRHPKEWWQIKLLEYMKIKHPDKVNLNPKIISVEDTHIWFGMQKHYGHFKLDKTTITETIKYANN